LIVKMKGVDSKDCGGAIRVKKLKNSIPSVN
jgi:hypothetical protein